MRSLVEKKFRKEFLVSLTPADTLQKKVDAHRTTTRRTIITRRTITTRRTRRTITTRRTRRTITTTTRTKHLRFYSVLRRPWFLDFPSGLAALSPNDLAWTCLGHGKQKKAEARHTKSVQRATVVRAGRRGGGSAFDGAKDVTTRTVAATTAATTTTAKMFFGERKHA